jgi:molybdate transport system ATP-binding protein
MLEVAISYRRGEFELEAELRLERQVCGIFGPSGGGKTTLLDLIAGLLRPERGHIRLGGRILVDSEAGICLPPEQRRIGYLFQDGCLFPHLTVLGNLRYSLKRRRRPGPDFDEVIDALGLADLIGRNAARLSGGERQRVALGRALLSAPELLLLDEPLASLDAALKERILPYLARITERFALPTLYVSHASEELKELSARTVHLESGRLRDGAGTMGAGVDAGRDRR